MARTIKERLITALEARGWNQDFNARTSKYAVFTNPHPEGKINYYVGKSGALRVGPNISHSRPSSLRHKLLREAEKILTEKEDF